MGHPATKAPAQADLGRGTLVFRVGSLSKRTRCRLTHPDLIRPLVLRGISGCLGGVFAEVLRYGDQILFNAYCHFDRRVVQHLGVFASERSQVLLEPRRVGSGRLFVPGFALGVERGALLKFPRGAGAFARSLLPL